MNYAQLAAKEDPFANLSPADAKKMFVYLNMVATPRMSDSDIYRRYGFVFPNGSMELDFGERTRLAIEVMQEIQGQSHGMENSGTNASPTESKTSSSGCLVPLIALFALTTLAFVGCGQKEPSIAEIEQGMVETFRRESGNYSDFLDAKAKRIGNGRWAVRMVGERNGVRRTLNATAVMDKNGDIHYYTD